MRLCSVGGHTGFLLTQSFFLLFEKKNDLLIIRFFLNFHLGSKFDEFLKFWSTMLNRVVPNTLEMRVSLFFFPETLSYLPLPTYHPYFPKNKQTNKMNNQQNKMNNEPSISIGKIPTFIMPGCGSEKKVLTCSVTQRRLLSPSLAHS